MNNKNKKLLIIAIVIFIIAICIFIYAKVVVNNNEDSEDAVKSTEEDETYVASFYDSSSTEYLLSDFFGKPIVLVLWSSDTENSFEMVELIEDIYDEYSDEVNFLVVNSNEPDEDIVETMEQCGYPFEIYYDLDEATTNYCDTSTLPTLVFFDENGIIVNKITSEIDEDTLLANIELLLIDDE